MLNDHDLNSHIRIVQSDHLVSKYVIGARLRFVYAGTRMFSSNILLLEFSFSSKSLFTVPTGKQMMCRWSRKEVE